MKIQNSNLSALLFITASMVNRFPVPPPVSTVSGNPVIALRPLVPAHRQASGRATVKLWILVAMTALAATAGCVLPRSHAPLAKKFRPMQTVALLPISDQDVFGADSDTNVVQLMNRVLDSLAKGRSSHLMGPKKIQALLEATPRLPTPPGGLPSEGPIENATFRQSLAELGGKLGVERIVFSEISYRRHPEKTEFGLEGEIRPHELPILIPTMEFTSGGTYVVRQVMIDVPGSRVVARSDGTHAYSQTYGQMCIVPMYFGRTAGHAVEVAAREALTKVLRQANMNGRPAKD